MKQPALPRWMTSRWLAAQKEKLEASMEHLHQEIDSETSQLKTPENLPLREPVDAAEKDRSDLQTAETVKVIASSFHEVKQALERIARKTYGRCVDCQEWIPKQRLAAMPSALRCVACQEAFEKGRGPSELT